MKWASLGLVLMSLPVAAAQEADGFRLNTQGLEASDHGRHVEAERLFRESVKVWKALGPAYEAHVATTQTNLAQSLGAQGKREEAVEVLESAVKQFRHALGPESIYTLTSINLLGANYLMLGEDDRAAALFKETLPIERRLYPNHVQLSRSLAGLSLVKLRAGALDEAMPLAEEGLAVALKAEGDNTLDAALVFSNVAEVHRMAGRPERALPLYRKARSLYEQLLGPEHPRVASILSQEGLILMNEGKISTAEKLMTQSLRILAKSCPDCVFERTVSQTNLGLLRMKQERYQEADRLLSEVVSLIDQHWGKPGRMLAGILQSLAEVREKQRRPEDAARLQQRADLILAYR